MQAFLEQTSAQLAQLFGPTVLQIITALAVLVLGWLVALILAAVVRGALRRTTLDNRLAKWVLGDEKAAWLL